MQIRKEKDLLTAKEWLEKEDKAVFTNGCHNNECCRLMSEYASYKTKVLEEEFSKYWKETEMKILELEGKIQFIENCNKHFNITTE